MNRKKNEIKNVSETMQTDITNRKKRNSSLFFAAMLGLACIAYMFTFYKGGKQGTTVVVTVDGEEYYRGSLFMEKELSIGKTNVLHIKGGRVDMISADCPDQICVKQMPVSQNGESIICLPNKVVVTVEALEKEKQTDELDAIVK